MDPGQEISESSQLLQIYLLGSDPVDSGDLIALGRKELNSAIASEGWQQPKPPEPQNYTLHSANCYRYHLRPPTILGSRGTAPLPVWGELSARESINHLSQLEDFDPLPLMHRPPESNSVPEVEWFTILPKPHSFSFPQAPQRASSLLNSSIVPFKPSHVFNDQSCKRTLSDPFARVSWWIPVQGALYHLFPSTSIPSFLSSAQLLNFQEDQTSQIGFTPPNDHIDRNITWTPESLGILWRFLIEVRELSNFGPITLSYNIQSKSCVYITIGCDAPAATRLRASLAAWKAPEGNDLRGIRDKYYLRLLRPCRLLLVDDSAKPLLVA